MYDIKKNNEKNNNNSSNEQIHINSYSKDSKLMLKEIKNKEQNILTELNNQNKETINNNNNLNIISSRKKSSIMSSNKDSYDKNNNNNHSMLKIKDNYINNNMKYLYDNNSISYYQKKINNNKDDINAFSNYILLQKNTRKSLTDINVIKKERNDKETISKFNENLNIKKINNYQEFKPKFMQHINDKSEQYPSNKIKLNNFIKSSKKYFLLYQPPKIIKKCFMCDSFGKVLFHAEKCNHLFCGICGKIYYEQQINNCIYKLKCPKYSCCKSININVLKQILSKYIFEKMMENMDGNSQTFDKNIINTSQNINSSRERIIRKNSMFSSDKDMKSIKENKTFIYNMTFQKGGSFNIDKNSCKKRSKKDLLLKKLTSRFHRNSDKDLANEHVIKIAGSSKFNKAVKKINEFKNIFCNNCNKASLFPVKNKPFIKCLNCGLSTCKFCYKKYDYFHFIRNNAHSCRVFFRTHISGKNTKYIYFYQLLYIFGGLLILYIGFTKIEARYISNCICNKIYSIYLFLFLILLIINLFVFIIILPYYPFILLIVDI